MEMTHEESSGNIFADLGLPNSEQAAHMVAVRWPATIEVHVVLPHQKAPVAASLTPASASLAERPVWWLTYPGRSRIGHSSGEHRFKKPNSWGASG